MRKGVCIFTNTTDSDIVVERLVEKPKKEIRCERARFRPLNHTLVCIFWAKRQHFSLSTAVGAKKKQRAGGVSFPICIDQSKVLLRDGVSEKWSLRQKRQVAHHCEAYQALIWEHTGRKSCTGLPAWAPECRWRDWQAASVPIAPSRLTRIRNRRAVRKIARWLRGQGRSRHRQILGTLPSRYYHRSLWNEKIAIPRQSPLVT